MLVPEKGFVFSFLRSEKFGTDCASGFSDCALRLPEKLEALSDDREGSAAEVRGEDEDELRLGRGFLVWVLPVAPSPKAASPDNLSDACGLSSRDPDSSSSL